MNAEYLSSRLDNPTISSDILLAQVKLLDSSSRESPAFNDPRYLPFYYHLGQATSPKKVEQIGPKLGLIAACFLQGCPTVEDWSSMDTMLDGKRPPMSIINSNIKKFFKGKLNSEHQTFCFGVHPNNLLIETGVDYTFDMGLLTDQYSPEHTQIMLDYFWKHLNPSGLLVVDYIHDEAVGEVFRTFCRVKNREPLVFSTRYGVGIVTR